MIYLYVCIIADEFNNKIFNKYAKSKQIKKFIELIFDAYQGKELELLAFLKESPNKIENYLLSNPSEWDTCNGILLYYYNTILTQQYTLYL